MSENYLLIIAQCLEYAAAFTDISGSEKAEVFLDKLEDEGYTIVGYVYE